MKIALVGPNGWALGSIHHFLEKYLSPYFEIKNFYWHDANQVQQALGGDYQIVIGEAHIMDLKGMGYTIGEDVTLIPIYHHNANIKSNAYNVDRNNSLLLKQNLYSVSREVASNLKQVFKVDSKMLPIGVCPYFWEKRSITHISKLGHVSAPYIRNEGYEEYEDIKQSRKFLDICSQVNIPGDHICGKHFSEGSRIYDGFDMVICTSISEGNPLPFLECAASKIPFISTKVGIIPDFSSVRTFSTIEEAVEIINYLNSSPKILRQYVDDVYEEVLNSRNWDKIIKEYWLPELCSIIKNKTYGSNN